jgi:uncharacterized protein (DUF2342 family)
MPDPFEIGPEFLGNVPLFAELQRLLRWDGGPVNWDLANQLAAAQAASYEGVGAAAIDADVAAATFRHATLLIEDVCELAIDGELELLGAVAFAERIATEANAPFEAVAARAASGIADGAGLSSMLGDAAPPGLGEALRAMGPMLQGAQVGQVIGAASGVTIGWADLGLPIERRGPVLLPGNLGRIVRADGLDERAALLAASLLVGVEHAVVTSFATLRTRFLSAILDLVATLEHDLSRFGESLRDADLSDPAKLQQALSGGIELERSADSEQAAQRADAIGALHLAAVDRYVSAAAARAGLDASVVAALRVTRARDEISALRGTIGLLPAQTDAADSFVSTIVLDGGFAALVVALDDPIQAPSVADLADPRAWLERTR